MYDTGHRTHQYNSDSLTLFLKKIDFLTDQNKQYVPSTSFMSLITFLGCSPNLNHDIETKISINLTHKKQALGGDSIVKLSCPNCQQKITDPTTLLKNYQTSPNWLSSCCKNKIALEEINWRKSAGFSHTFIQISNIFPKEAIPSDDFMLLLFQFSQSHWNYFYSKQHIF